METKAVVFRGWGLGKESSNKGVQRKFSVMEFYILNAASHNCLLSSKSTDCTPKRKFYCMYIIPHILYLKRPSKNKKLSSAYSKLTNIFWANVAPHAKLTSLDVHILHPGPLIFILLMLSESCVHIVSHVLALFGYHYWRLKSEYVCSIFSQ